MNGKKENHKMIKKYGKIVWTAFIFLAILAAGGAVSVEGMEFGGFDVDVGSGQSWEYPSDWDSFQENDIQGSDIQGSDVQGSNVQGNSGQGSEIREDAFPWASSQWGNGQNNGGSQNYDNDWQGGVYGESDAYGEWNPYTQPGPYGQPDVQQQGQILYPQEAQAWAQQPEKPQQTDTENNIRQEGNAHRVENQGAQEKLPVEPTPSMILTPAVSPVSAEEKGQCTPASTPVPDKSRKPEQTAFAKENDEVNQSFTYYNKKKGGEASEDDVDDSITFHHDLRPQNEGLPEVYVKSQGTVQILSVHFNGEECSWHWKEDVLVLDKAAEGKDNRIEILAVSEKGKLAVMEPWIF